MTHARPKHPLAALLSILLLSLFLTACGGGGGAGGGEVVAILSWEAPTENTDNTPLEDLEGFRLYIGDSPSSLQPVMDIPADQTQLEITSSDIFNAVTQLDGASGNMPIYFALTAYNSLRIESSLSEIVSKAF